MTRTKTVYPHPVGTHGRSSDWALRHEQDRNQRAWRPVLARKFDRNTPEKSLRYRMAKKARELFPDRKGGTALADYGEALRPLPYRIFARRRVPQDLERWVRAGLSIPETFFRHSGQQTGALFEVLCVGENVTSVKPGDVVVALAYIGTHMGDTVGDEIFCLWCDCDRVNSGPTATIRGDGGDVLAVVEDPPPAVDYPG